MSNVASLDAKSSLERFFLGSALFDRVIVGEDLTFEVSSCGLAAAIASTRQIL